MASRKGPPLLRVLGLFFGFFDGVGLRDAEVGVATRSLILFTVLQHAKPSEGQKDKQRQTPGPCNYDNDAKEVCREHLTVDAAHGEQWADNDADDTCHSVHGESIEGIIDVETLCEAMPQLIEDSATDSGDQRCMRVEVPNTCTDRNQARK